MEELAVLLVDDLALIRQGIRAVLNGNEDIRIVGETDNAEEGVRLSRALGPRVVLMDQDVGQPGDGVAATHQIKQARPDVEIVIMTDRLDDETALRAIEAGAMGYILKDIPGPNLAGALRAVCNGRAFFHPAMTRKLLDRLGRMVREQRGRDRLEPKDLTPREVDVLTEVAKGRTDHEIAAGFVLTQGTVKTHIRHALRKLSARNRAQAVAHVIRRGIIK